MGRFRFYGREVILLYLDEEERLPIITELWNHLKAQKDKLTIDAFKKYKSNYSKTKKLIYANSASYLWRDIGESSYSNDEELQEVYTDILKID